MRFISRILRNILSLLLLLALAAGAVWLIAQSRPQPPETAGGAPAPLSAAPSQQSPLPTPTQPPGAPLAPSPTPIEPSPVPTAVARRVPFCTFPGGPPPDKGGPSLDKYVFGEPQTILTDTVAIDIVDWLPDNRRLLIIRGGRIETLDTRTGAVQVYSTEVSGDRPIWLPQSQAVAYVKAPIGVTEPSLWVSQGGAAAVRPVIESFSLDTLTVDSSGYLIYFTPPGQQPLPVPEVARGFFQVQSIPVSQAELLYPKYPIDTGYKQYLMAARRPGGAQIAFYSDPYLYLYDVAQSRVCEVDLGVFGPEELPVFPYAVKWSPNGRFLAMLTTARFPGDLLSFAKLVILDATSGALIESESPLAYLSMDVAWGPDNQSLMMLGYDQIVDGRPIQKLRLVEAFSGKVRPALSERVFGGGAREGRQMAWSGNGHDIAVKCPIWAKDKPQVVQDQLCLISASMHP
ncbi:MAG: hypothetical protein CVU38_20545 [Chloroflexi bacterium HGW-Chloroflexi-1]|nr:MAG: hypothetical protein CVU38_20545 [Chloroflexi bacterium HGW-Chloroflexi-1]